MISLLKILDIPWEKAKNYLRLDLEHIESAINQRWGAVFGDTNKLQSGAIEGDATQPTRYVANTGPNNAPNWDQVNLANGVKERLPFNHLVSATLPGVLVGRESGSPGDFEQLGLGPGLVINDKNLRLFPGGFVGSLPLIGLDGEDGLPGPPGLTGQQGLQGPPGLSTPNLDSDDYLEWPIPAPSTSSPTIGIVASTFEKAETGTDANVLTYTTGLTDEFLNVQV